MNSTVELQVETEIGQCNVCCATMNESESLPCGHLTCDSCLDEYIKVTENSIVNRRLTFVHLFCPMRCGKFIGHHHARNKSDEVKEKMILAEKTMADVQRMAVEKWIADGGMLPDSEVNECSSGSVGLVEAPTEEAREVIAALPYRLIEKALSRYAFYRCNKCREYMFGGLVACEAAAAAAADEQHAKPEPILCNSCCIVGGKGTTCAVHGKDSVEFKCMFCCRVRPVTYNCGGTDHYCEECHKNPGAITPCDATDCVFQGKHPQGFPSGVKNKRYSLGCIMCRAEPVATASAVMRKTRRHRKKRPEQLLNDFCIGLERMGLIF